ncbi:hypothetical protein SEVIR_6G241500v4 [Setaria viridis]|uniref:TraB domain-containing protein n=1 Tax=Setaria viridis TaxID=4556 RepID=A0A4U6U7F4_SETVI|nr:hypothetical protein SEVIR_6G241500v2 [Setaria viridis]TKW11579.1 hypothetical protein SEVIR_6G241500v2 [Setaria viridis]
MAAGPTPSATAASFRPPIPPPPPCFDYRAAVLADTRAAAAGNPALAGLVESGALVRVPRRRFGPVPAWRPPDFVEPEEVWILGTSHLSPESVADVERVLRAVQPDNVVVELCRSRAGIMYVSDASDEPLLKSNMFSLGGAKFFGAVNRSINLGGQSALALRLLLAVFSSKISSGANRPFGEEFRAARKVSEDIGAQLVLGDRPIEITLERAWKSLTWDQKTNLVISLFRGITATIDTPQDGKTAVSPYELYEKLSTSYPSLLQPLIHERDMFLAWSLKRSKAVNKSKTVVGVVGKGHMNGIVYALISDQGDLRFRDLVGRESSDTWVTSLIKGLVRDTMIGLVLWALYEQLQAVL